jgi:hypothetical protein
MVRMLKRALLMLGMMILLMAIASAQAHQQTEVLSIQGCSGKASVVQWQERVLVDVQDLARITNGSLSFERERVILTLSGCNGSGSPIDDGKASFSRGFMRAAIEAMASIRELGGVLQVIVQNGYPVEKNTAGQTIGAYQSRAADSVALASTAASTDSDFQGLALLRNEFDNVQAWSDAFVEARSAMSAADLTMSENPFKGDQQAQKIITCGQFLAQMFAGGTFQDHSACH